jgi:TonB family protein
MKTILSLSLFSILVFQSTSLGQDQQKTGELTEAAALNETVVKLFNEKKYAEALPLTMRALEIQERLLPADDERIELSLKQLGDIQFATNDFNAAKDTYNRLLQKQVLRVGTDGLPLAATFDRLAVLYFRENSDRDAQNASTRALTIREAKLGPNHPDVAQNLYGLGEQFRMRGSANSALPFYLRALTIYAEHSGIKSPEFEKVSQGFMCSVYESRRWDLYKELVDLRKRYTPLTSNTIEGGVLNGRALSLPKPEYPSKARERGEAGVVVVKVTIDETGKVINANDICQGPPNISAASVKAAMKARFTPTKLSGQPVKVTGVIQYNFVKGR